MEIIGINMFASSGRQFLKMKKFCKKCNKYKSKTCFPKNSGRGDGRGGYCKLCQRKLGMENYLKNKERYKKVARKRDIALKLFITKLKDKPCTDCKKKYPPYVMDFDHINKDNKIANVSYLKRHRVAFDKILKEVDKCELVCANCHRIRSYKRQSKYTHYGKNLK